uniref:Lysosomal cystine transporter family protein n=1 Tax=Cucumis melo subsp. melo TaxID=412675 RepID=E5GCE1_CUCME|nr:lysosomal cystine transporter family protein [Cucumis melo subsp. melo]
MVPVALSDVFFPSHAILLIFVVTLQIVFFERGNQKVSKAAIGIFVSVWFFAACCVLIASSTHSWLWLISMFNSIQVFMTLIKCSPQAFMNFSRKSTVGFSIDPIVLDLIGGVTTLVQMSVQSIDQVLFSVRFEDVNVTNIFILAEAEACGNETNESLDAKANSALECPYIADLRRGATNAPI